MEQCKIHLGCTGAGFWRQEIVTRTRRRAAAIGVRADGSVVFYAIDGRQPGKSYGLRLPTLARRQDLAVLMLLIWTAEAPSVMGRMPGAVPCPFKFPFGWSAKGCCKFCRAYRLYHAYRSFNTPISYALLRKIPCRCVPDHIGCRCGRQFPSHGHRRRCNSHPKMMF